MARVTVFHTSDMHNKLTADLAQRLHDLRNEHPESLMFDCGDAIWSGNIYWRPGGEPVHDLMNSVPYDAMCMGNREYHFLAAGIESKVSRAEFAVLSANLRSTKPANGCSPTEPYIFFERDGIRIAVMGLSVPCITERMLVKKMSDYYFVPPIEAAMELVPELRKQCDLLIALTHIGIKVDRELADAVQGIDLILGGHTHVVTEQPERVGETRILHSGFYAHYVRRVEIELENGRVDVTSELMPLGKA